MAKKKYEWWLTEDGQAMLATLARRGLTDEELADAMHISRSTLAVWKQTYPDISDTLTQNKQIADAKIENVIFDALLNGQTTKTTTSKMVKEDPNVLKAKRARRLNELKVDPACEGWGKAELTEQVLLDVPTWIEIPQTVMETHTPPNIASAMKWMRNRDPEHWTDTSYRELNNAQAEKAKADAELARVKADQASDLTAPITVNVTMPPNDDEETEDE